MGELLDYHQLRSSTFMYPDEATRPGSTTAFIALHEALRRTDRSAMGFGHHTHTVASAETACFAHPDAELPT